MSRLSFDQQVKVISALIEGCSIRAADRLCGIDRGTIMRLGVTVGEACQRLHDALMIDIQVNVLELDELWSFVLKKEAHVRPEDPAEAGDQYTYLAIDSTRKAIVSFATGKRDQRTTNAFAADLRRRIINRPQINSDGFPCYPVAIDRAFGDDCDFAQIVKLYGPPDGDDRRYSPPRCIGVDKRSITGNPDMERASTSYVERTNLSVRTHLRRFTRLSLGHSKKLRNHAAAVALFVGYFNFCRIHETLRCTPAMALDVVSRAWSIADLLDAALSIAPSPPPAPEPEQLSLLTSPTRRLTVLKGGVA